MVWSGKGEVYRSWHGPLSRRRHEQGRCPGGRSWLPHLLAANWQAGRNACEADELMKGTPRRADPTRRSCRPRQQRHPRGRRRNELLGEHTDPLRLQGAPRRGSHPQRNLVERLSNRIEQFRDIPTRYGRSTTTPPPSTRPRAAVPRSLTGLDLVPDLLQVFALAGRHVVEPPVLLSRLRQHLAEFDHHAWRKFADVNPDELAVGARRVS